MSKGNTILIDLEPRGVFREGYVEGVVYPGQLVKVKPGVSIDGTGRHTWVPYDEGADGDRTTIWVVLENKLEGKLFTDPYATGDRIRVYSPISGEHLNIIIHNVTGTADDIAVGDKMIAVDGTGHVIVTTGSPESEPFIAMEAITDPTADQLLWVEYTGH